PLGERDQLGQEDCAVDLRLGVQLEQVAQCLRRARVVSLQLQGGGEKLARFDFGRLIERGVADRGAQRSRGLLELAALVVVNALFERRGGQQQRDQGGHAIACSTRLPATTVTWATARLPSSG